MPEAGRRSLTATVPRERTLHEETPGRLVSVVIPARDEEGAIGRCVSAVLAQAVPTIRVEILVVDDGSSDATAARARAAGARVVRSAAPGAPGSAGAARNLGARLAEGDPIVFLDADCEPAPGWLDALLEGHREGAEVVGGSLALPQGLSLTARCDYYCGWYLVHPARPAGRVPHHPPPNLSVRRAAFRATTGFREELPVGYTNEERAWQGEVRRNGGTILFEPRAVAYHHNRPGFLALLRRNYRWASTAVRTKGASGAARMAFLYQWPLLLIIASPFLLLAHTLFILGCWARSRIYEPLALAPLILLSRLAYVAGLVMDAVRALGSGWPAVAGIASEADEGPRAGRPVPRRSGGGT